MSKIKKSISNLTKLEQVRSWNQSDISRQCTAYRWKKVHFDSTIRFLDACINFYKDEINDLLKSGVDVNCSDKDNLTALHQACINSRIDIVEYLLLKNADINACDKEGWTPLHIAADIGSYELSKFLIEHGARLDAANHDGDLPIMYVNEEDCPDLKIYFQREMDKRKINIEECSNYEKTVMMKDVMQWKFQGKYVPPVDKINNSTPVHVAASKNYVEILMELLPLLTTKEINVQDVDGWTALHAAAHWGHKDACFILINHGADPNIRTRANETVLDIVDSDLKPLLEEEIKRAEVEETRRTQELKNDILLRAENANRRRSSITRQSVEWKKNTQMKDPASERQVLKDAKSILPIEEHDEKLINSPPPHVVFEDFDGCSFSEDISSVSTASTSSLASKVLDFQTIPVESLVVFADSEKNKKSELPKLSNTLSDIETVTNDVLQSNQLLNGDKSKTNNFSDRFKLQINDSNNGAAINQIYSDTECDEDSAAREAAVKLRPKSQREEIKKNRDTTGRLSLVMAPAKAMETEVMRREKSRRVRSVRRSTQAIDVDDIKDIKEKRVSKIVEKEEVKSDKDVQSFKIQTNVVPLNKVEETQRNSDVDIENNLRLPSASEDHATSPRNLYKNCDLMGKSFDQTDSNPSVKTSPLKYQISCPLSRKQFTSNKARENIVKKLSEQMTKSNDRQETIHRKPQVNEKFLGRGINVNKCLESNESCDSPMVDSANKSTQVSKNAESSREKDSGSFVAKPFFGNSVKSKDDESNEIMKCNSASFLEKKFDKSSFMSDKVDHNDPYENQISKTVITQMLNDKLSNQELKKENMLLKEEIKELKEKPQNNDTHMQAINKEEFAIPGNHDEMIKYQSEISKLREENKILKSQKDVLLRVISKIQQELEGLKNLQMN